MTICCPEATQSGKCSKQAYSPTLVALAGRSFEAAVGGFKILALFEASQEDVEASNCKEASERKNVQ